MSAVGGSQTLTKILLVVVDLISYEWQWKNAETILFAKPFVFLGRGRRKTQT